MEIEAKFTPKGLFRKSIDPQKIYEFAMKFITAHEGHIFESGQQLILKLCPEGQIFLECHDKALYAYCMSGHVGPGLHVQANEFLDELLQNFKLSSDITDTTNYRTHRDFHSLQNDFHECLKSVLSNATEKNGEQAIYVNWPFPYLLQHTAEDTWYCNIGEYKTYDILLYQSNIASFASEFFIWPNRTKDALFYRNSALSDAWSRYSYQQVEAGGLEIIKKLEKAVSLDRFVPFPKALYCELCSIHNHEPIDLSGLSNKETPNVGFRKRPTLVQHEGWMFPLDGGFCALNRGDNTIYSQKDREFLVKTTFYDASKVNPEEVNKALAGRYFDKMTSDECIRIFPKENAQIKMYKINWHLPYIICSMLMPPGTTLTMTFYFAEAEDYHWALDIINSAAYTGNNRPPITSLKE